MEEEEAVAMMMKIMMNKIRNIVFCQNMGLTTKETYQLPANYKTGKLKCLHRFLL